MLKPIKYDALPERIRQTYFKHDLTKALQQGSAILILNTRWGYRHVWRLRDKEWHWVKSTDKGAKP